MLTRYLIDGCHLLFISWIQHSLYYLMKGLCRILCFFRQYNWAQNVHFDQDNTIYQIAPISTSSYCELFKMHKNVKKTLVIDLDETLINSKYENLLYPVSLTSREPDYSSWISVDKHLIKFIVYKRPFVDVFLDIVSQWYDLIVYTASMESYGNCVIDFLEHKKTYFKKRFFRQHCDPSAKGFQKNLYLCCNDLSNVAIIDNSPLCYEKFQDNAIPISTWISENCCDTALIDIIPFLDALRFTNDVRHILKRRTLTDVVT